MSSGVVSPGLTVTERPRSRNCPDADSCQGPTKAWYASPGSCNAPVANGTASVDLTTTDFRVAAGQGWEAEDGGVAAVCPQPAVSNQGQVLAIVGGGQCATCVPAPAYAHRLELEHR